MRLPIRFYLCKSNIKTFPRWNWKPGRVIHFRAFQSFSCSIHRKKRVPFFVVLTLYIIVRIVNTTSMSYETIKIIKGHKYGYKVESYRENGKIRQRIIEYHGRIDNCPAENGLCTQDECARMKANRLFWTKCGRCIAILDAERNDKSYLMENQGYV